MVVMPEMVIGFVPSVYVMFQGEVPVNAILKFLLRPAQLVLEPDRLAVGLGLTVMVKVLALPAHALAVGVTLMVATIGALVLLVAVKEGILPVPAAAKPMAVLLLVQA